MKRLDFSVSGNIDVMDVFDCTSCAFCVCLHVQPRSDVCDGSPLRLCDSRSSLLSYQIPLALLSLLVCGISAAAAALCKPLQLVFFFSSFLFFSKSFFLRKKNLPKKKKNPSGVCRPCRAATNITSPRRAAWFQTNPAFREEFFSLFFPSFSTGASQIQ